MEEEKQGMKVESELLTVSSYEIYISGALYCIVTVFKVNTGHMLHCSVLDHT